FDRGPMDSTKLVGAGSWSAYWYNGYIVSSEIARGLDVFELVPSGFISQNEIDAAKLVHFDFLNVQDQPKLVWPPSFVVALGYLAKLMPEFDKRRAKVVGLSVDPVESHARWSQDIEETQGYAPNYPVIGDTDLKVSKLYGTFPAGWKAPRPYLRIVPQPRP